LSIIAYPEGGGEAVYYFFGASASSGFHPQMAQIEQIFLFLFCVISEICGYDLPLSH
jgi:hypothetical protein